MSARGSNKHAGGRSELHRLELHHLLVQKLTAKYGQGHEEVGAAAQSDAANRVIQAEVDLFMHSHRKVHAGDLAGLERAVRRAVGAGGDNEIKSSRITARPNTAGPRSSTYRDSSSQGGKHRSDALSHRRCPRVVNTARSSSASEASSNSSMRPSTAGSVTSRRNRQQLPHQRRQGEGSVVPAIIKNEWLILDTYQQLKMEEKQAEEERQAREAIQRCRQDLDEQIKQNLARKKREKDEAEIRNEEQRQLLLEHLAHQAELKEASRKKQLEERCVRASQILANNKRREKERRENEIDEERALAECKQKLREEKEAQLEKRRQVVESIRAMDKENTAKLAMRRKQKLQDAEEDTRLMREYRERLDREQAERAAAHSRRLQRYEMIGNQWAKTGAGKRQHDIDVAEEKRVLTQAAIKEKADEDREIRDKEALRLDRIRCLEDNRRLAGEKLAREKAEEAEEAIYAQRFRLEGEAHVAQGADRKRKAVLAQKAYARKLKDQMRATREALATIQMTDRERGMNGNLLRLLKGDKDLQAKISRRILQNERGQRKSGSRG